MQQFLFPSGCSAAIAQDKDALLKMVARRLIVSPSGKFEPLVKKSFKAY